MTDVPGWKLATYSPGDEVGILRLFKQVFKVERTLDRWSWEYFIRKVYETDPLRSSSERKAVAVVDRRKRQSQCSLGMTSGSVS